LAAFKMKRQQAAHRRYLAAIQALTTFRKLLPGAGAVPAGNSTKPAP
jgi:hypothetical protein